MGQDRRTRRRIDQSGQSRCRSDIEAGRDVPTSPPSASLGCRKQPGDDLPILLERWLSSGDETFSQILARLSARQGEVLRVFLLEPNDARVARALDLDPATVRSHMMAIERALRAKGRPHLVMLCLAALISERSPWQPE